MAQPRSHDTSHDLHDVPTRTHGSGRSGTITHVAVSCLVHPLDQFTTCPNPEGQRL